MQRMRAAQFSILVVAIWLGIIGGVNVLAEEPARLYIEAEDCERLPAYPYHNEDATGWYARNASCRLGAPGRAWCAAIHSNTVADQRTMSIKLKKPLPAGKYQAFLRVLGPRAVTTDSIVMVRIGKTPAEFRWREGAKGRCFWLPAVEVNLADAADSVSFRAVQFGGAGHRGMYEPLNFSIWVDTLYLTSDMKEKSPPDIVAERLIRAGLDPKAIAPRPVYKADETGTREPVTPLPENPSDITPILLV